MVCFVWNCSWFYWKSWLLGKGAVVKTARGLTTINLLVRLEVMKKFFSRSQTRTVYRLLFVFFFCIEPAGILWAFQPSADVCFLNGALSASGMGPQYWFAVCHWECCVVGKRGRCYSCSTAALQVLGVVGPGSACCSFALLWLPQPWKSQLTAVLF